MNKNNKRDIFPYPSCPFDFHLCEASLRCIVRPFGKFYPLAAKPQDQELPPCSM